MFRSLLLFLAGVFIVPVLLGAQVGALSGTVVGFHKLFALIFNPLFLIGFAFVYLIFKSRKPRSDRPAAPIVYVERPTARSRRW